MRAAHGRLVGQAATFRKKLRSGHPPPVSGTKATATSSSLYRQPPNSNTAWASTPSSLGADFGVGSLVRCTIVSSSRKPDLRRKIERAMAEEDKTVGKRRVRG